MVERRTNVDGAAMLRSGLIVSRQAREVRQLANRKIDLHARAGVVNALYGIAKLFGQFHVAKQQPPLSGLRRFGVPLPSHVCRLS